MVKVEVMVKRKGEIKVKIKVEVNLKVCKSDDIARRRRPNGGAKLKAEVKYTVWLK